MHFSVRLWIELYLGPIMEELDTMEEAWGKLESTIMTTDTGDGDTSATLREYMTDMKRDEEERLFDDLVSATGGGHRTETAYRTKRPLY